MKVQIKSEIHVEGNTFEEAMEEMQIPTLDEVREMLVAIRDRLNSYAWLQHMFFYEIKPGQVNTLRADGLEKVQILDEAHSPALFEQ